MVIVLTRVATLAAEVPEHQHSKSMEVVANLGMKKKDRKKRLFGPKNVD